MTNQFFITRAEEALASLLREIPGLVEDLAITLTRQDCLSAGGNRVAVGSDEQPLPINAIASEAHDFLRSTVASWVRHVWEYRAMEWQPIEWASPNVCTWDFIGPLREREWRLPCVVPEPSTTELASWLAHHVTSLAMTEGCEEAYGDIDYAMSQCRIACDRPRDPSWMAASVELAAATRLNARGIEALAREMGGATGKGSRGSACAPCIAPARSPRSRSMRVAMSSSYLKPGMCWSHTCRTPSGEGERHE